MTKCSTTFASVTVPATYKLIVFPYWDEYVTILRLRKEDNRINRRYTKVKIGFTAKFIHITSNAKHILQQCTKYICLWCRARLPLKHKNHWGNTRPALELHVCWVVAICGTLATLGTQVKLLRGSSQWTFWVWSCSNCSPTC